MPEREHLELQGDARAQTASYGHQERDEDGHHRREAYPRKGWNINVGNENGIFGRHNDQLSETVH